MAARYCDECSPMTAALLLPSIRNKCLFATLLSAVLVLRMPTALTNPDFWAEDGNVFFADAFNQGFVSTILHPSSGYLQTLPRIVAGLSLLFPSEYAPLVFSLIALTVQAIPTGYILSDRCRNFLGPFPLRLLVALVYVVVPNSAETYLNAANSQWYLVFTAILILQAAPPRADAS